MAQASGNRRNEVKRQNRTRSSGQYGGQNIYHQQQQYTSPVQEPQQLGANMPQQTFVQRGKQMETRKTGLTAAQKKERLLRKREQERKKRRNYRIAAAFAVILVILGGYKLIRMVSGSSGGEEDTMDVLDLTETVDPEEAAYSGPPVATISFLGDVSVSADQVAAATGDNGNIDFTSVFTDIADQLEKTDYAVCNFETTMVDNLNYGGEPYYNAPIQLAGALNSLGIRLVSTANTYMLNNGIDGLISTRKYLHQAGLSSVGTYVSQEERDENSGVYLRTIHKITFGFLSYTKGTDAVTMPDGCEYAMNTLYTDYSDYWTDLRASQIRSDVQAAKNAGAEVVVMLVHWGSEYSRSVSDPQKELASKLFSYGVDVIIGTHSHVVNSMEFQDVELSDGTKKKCFVAYGLGDFYTDPEKESGQESVILNLTFARGEDGQVTITEAGYVPIYQNIVENNGKRSFQVLDAYSTLAGLYRSNDISSQDATLYNNLLDTISTVKYYAGEEFDIGPADADLRVVRQAIESGEYSVFDIRAIQEEEKEAEKNKANEAPEATAEPEEEPVEEPVEEPEEG